MRTTKTFPSIAAMLRLLSSAATLAVAAWAGPAQPLISFTNPPSANPGAGPITLKVYGSGFAAASQVQWRVAKVTTSLATTFVSGHEVDATVPASLLTSNGTPVVQVATTSASITRVSNSWPFPISPANSGTLGYTQLPQAAGNGPSSVAVGDFNNDGIPDVAVVNSQDNTLEILFGQGDGNFPNGTLSPIGMTPVFVVAGDFNNDGKLDVAIANQGDDNIEVFPGNGDGTFGSGQKITLSTGTLPTYLAVGDFNNDGNLDLVVVFQNEADILYGDGDGTFSKTVFRIAGTNFSAAAVADFNNDGNLDLALMGTNGAVYIVLGNGAGAYTFLTPKSVTSGLPEYLAVGDFNGDGKADLVVTSSTTSDLLVLLGNGDGTFNGENFGTGSGLGVGVGDLNGDGSADFAIMDTSNALTPFVGNGAGGFFLLSPITLTAGQGTQVAVGDFNGDGILDMAVGSQTGNSFFVLLSGPVAGASPSSLTFSSQAVGTNSSSQAVTLTNTGFGPNPLNISSIAASGDFSQTNNCGSSLASGASCTINVTFSPTAAGTRNGSLTITDTSQNPAGSTQTISLTGTAFTAVPTVGPLPSGHDFGPQNVGTTSGAYQVSLNNTGTGALTINSIATTGDFGQTNNCGSSLAAGSSCKINVTFTPSVAGNRSGALVITDNNNNVANSMQTVTLSGTGSTKPMATLSSSALTFGLQDTGTHSPSQSITLSNPGGGTSATLTINSISTTGDFTQTNNCGTSLAAQTSCTIQVTFSPSSQGPHSGTLTVTDNNNAVPGSTQTASLMGTGITVGTTPAPLITSVFPASAQPGAAGLELEVKGEGGTHLDWTVGTTTTRLTRAHSKFFVPADLLANPGTATLTLIDPAQTAPGVRKSNPVPFPIATTQPAAIFSQKTISKHGGAAVATADFNGDGNADMVTSTSTGVQVLLGTGKGGFQGAAPYSASLNVNAMAVGDFNGDGKPDLVVNTFEPNQVVILLGKGDGTFTTGGTLSIGSPGAIAVADFNRDGYLDVAVESDGAILILMGNGDGTLFPAGTVTNTTGAPFLVGNFGGPVGVDLLAFDTFTSLSTFYGNGDGTFTKHASTTVPVANFLTAMAEGDFFDTVRPGVALVISGKLVVLRPEAGGAFKTVTTVPLGYDGQWWLVSGDFNGDGQVDLALTNSKGELTLLKGNGKGEFAAGTIANVSASSRQLALADLNGDGRLDLVIGGERISTLIQPAFEVSTGHLRFVSTSGGPTKPRTVTLTNTSGRSLRITSISVSGRHAAEFSSGLSNTCGTSLASGGTCEVSVTYTPAKTPERVTADLVLEDSDGKQAIGLEGQSK